jgi:hypothetical protein
MTKTAAVAVSSGTCADTFMIRKGLRRGQQLGCLYQKFGFACHRRRDAVELGIGFLPLLFLDSLSNTGIVLAHIRCSPRIDGRSRTANLSIHWCPEGDLNPHDRLGSADFKSAVSADFTIRAVGIQT